MSQRSVFAALCAAVSLVFPNSGLSAPEQTSCAVDVFAPYAELKGTGEDATHIDTRPLAVEPSAVYVVSCRTRHPEGKDTGVGVLQVGNISTYPYPKGNDWRAFTNVIMTAADAKRLSCSLRQWHIPGTFEYADVRLTKVTPRYRKVDGLDLGFGESMDGHDYHYGTRFSSACHTESRPLVAVRNVSIGNGCIHFYGNTSLDFVHGFPGRKFRSGQVGLVCERAKAGAVRVSVSADGKNWTDVLTVTNAGHHVADIPAALLPADRVLVRVNAAPKSSVSINHCSFDATVDGAPAFGFGATEYVDASGRTLFAVRPWDFLSDATSGECLPGGSGKVSFWRQSTGRKVFRGRPLPTATVPAVRLATARNEEEAVQFVVRPSVRMSNVRVEARMDGDFDVEVRRVGYLMIDYLADDMGARGNWPDPIFPQEKGGCAIAAGENQPFWVSVKPGKAVKAGVHRGSIRVTGSAGTFTVPLEVRVFGFDFPDKVTCESAFGLAWTTVFDYQRIKKREDKEAVVEKYLAHFARHHIAPYSPLVLVNDPSYTIKWTKTEKKEDSVPVFDWTKWDAEVDRVLGKYHFTTLKLHLRGIGGGDMSGTGGTRKFNGATEGTELFDIYISRYLKAIEDHLREKGILDRVYVYTFDEPLPQHFKYVNESLALLKKHAPGLRRMVTVEPREEFVGGINLWCPITEEFNREASAAAQARGEEVWWYITFSSKPPKVNEHVEHAGVDMRVWLWQTWLEKVTGILMWEVAHWNRKSIHPDPAHPQNPYVDTICWGGERPWNSGEGRYIFPPVKCFETTEPVLEGPVDSIRFEMLREGLEDYEYFAMLKKLDPKNPLLAVPADVTTSTDEYSTDPSGMERHRIRLAKELERLCGRGEAARR